jgi:hypothetical protein
MATLDSIADEIGFTRNELMQSMVKFGLTNRDWRNEGLTAHKRLPRYQENPDMATKPPSAAQLAARARFAEMARNGSLNRKRQIAAKKRAKNPVKKTVSEKISQLVHEGYPQRQAVAVALNEQRAGKVKRNPRKTMKSKKVSYESSLNRGRLKSYVVRDMEKSNDIAEFMSKSDAMKYAQYYSDKHDVQVSVRSV